MSRAVPANANHRVPEHARAETARTLAATPGIADPRRERESQSEPTDAERGRTLLAEARTGTLATLTPSLRGAGALDGGFPFGSLVAYAVDGAGRPLLCLSDLTRRCQVACAAWIMRRWASTPGSR